MYENSALDHLASKLDALFQKFDKLKDNVVSPSFIPHVPVSAGPSYRLIRPFPKASIFLIFYLLYPIPHIYL